MQVARRATFLLFVAVGLCYFVGADDLILPAKPIVGGVNVVFVEIQGAQLDASRYATNLLAIQAEAATYNIALWAGMPNIALDLPILQSEVNAGVARVLVQLQAVGAPTDAPFFIAGHSFGAVGAMGYGAEFPFNVTGAVFYGASLIRKYGDTYPIPFLAVNGEMDGLQRPSRVAESFYRHVIHTGDPASVFNSSSVILLGVDHLQFADGQNPPAAVKSMDLQAQVSFEEASAAIAQATAAFVAIHTVGDSQASDIISKLVSETHDFLAPLIDVMLNQEANIHLRPSCDSDHPSPQCRWYPAWPIQNNSRTPSNNTDCTCEVEWANTAATVMAGLPIGYTVVAINAVHDVTDTKPYHHAHIWTNCTGPCVFNLTTVAQQIYPAFDNLDTGFTQATASELRVKMKSRQAAFQQSGVQPNASTDVDSPSICATINQLAVQYALDHLSPVALARFQKYGQPIVTADDISPILPIGPLWIYNPLKLDEVQINGEWVLRVTAPTFRTPVDGWITKLYPDSNGYHYCKLLSPARAMEWMYTDGLRRKLGLNSTM